LRTLGGIFLQEYLNKIESTTGIIS